MCNFYLSSTDLNSSPEPQTDLVGAEIEQRAAKKASHKHGMSKRTLSNVTTPIYIPNYFFRWSQETQ